MRAICRVLIVALLPVFPARAAEPKLPTFTDVTERAGVRFKHSFGDMELSNIVEGTGSGCMFFDYDNDGWLDIYLVNGRYRPDVNDNTGRRLKGKLSNRLFHNNRDGTFSDVTEKAGVGGGDGYGVACSAADYDGDGNIDLFVCNYGGNILYHNNGDGTFTDVTKKAGLSLSRWPSGAPVWSVSGVWFDYDGDGRLDLYVANYLEYDGGKFRSYFKAQGYPGPLSYNGTSGILYHNNGDGTFTDVTRKTGVYLPGGRAMSATAADLNNDGHPDLFVANDSMECYYFENTGKGTFKERALEMGLAFGEGGQGVSHMGPCIGDVDRDGWLDIFIPDMGYGCLLMNHKYIFEDRTTKSGVARISGQYTGWGGCLFDYDNDGYLDLFVANGDAHHLYVQESVLARNDGHGNFHDVARQSGDYFQKKYVGRGAAYGDFMNDGHVGLLVANLDDSPRLLKNEGGDGNNWLTVVAKLPNGKTDAIGARVVVTAGGLVQIHDLYPVVGYLSQSDPRPHFGLGKAAKADKLDIRWPDQTWTHLTDVPVNRFLKIVQPAARR
ncbi:MAG: CRTAC1 family protein [Thermoguttaceae bacterium]